MRPGERRLYPVCTHGQLINRAAGPRLSGCAGSSCTSRWRTGSVHPLVCQRRRRQVKAYAQPPDRRGWLLPHWGSSSPSIPLPQLRMDAGSTLCALLRRSPRLDSAMEACSGAHSYGRKAHRSNLHRLSHPRSRCSHNAAPSGWAGRLPAAELPWSALSMKLGRPLVRGAQVAAAKQRAGARRRTGWRSPRRLLARGGS